MPYPWMDDFFISEPGTTRDYQPDWKATRFFLADKMYAMIGGDKFGAPIVTLKSDPFVAEVLRKEYKDIVPGYYMNKQHWNSVYLDGTVPDEVMKDMIDRAHNLVLEKLPKKVRENLLQQEEKGV